MSKRLFKTMVAVLAIAAAAAGPVRGQNASPDVTLDFTTNSWGIPEGTDGKTAAVNSYTSGGYTITLCGSSGNGYYFSLTDPYILLGKQGAYLQLPAFESAVDSIHVVGTSGASTGVEQNIYVGDVAVSTPTTGMKNVTQKYVINENYRTAGTIYRIKVTSANNTQIKKVYVYFAPAPTPHTVRMAEGTEDAANWTLASGNASVPGTQVLENVMSGSQVTATYNGTTKKVKSVKAVKYVAPAATVTTEPTATGAIIEVGSTAALVNAGAASGGTMMYAVTTTDAQPASTAGFSASVPTAQDRTAGTYYVWYYVEGDADHSDSEIAGPVSVTVTSAAITVTWNASDITGNGYGTTFTKDGVTITAGFIDFMEKNFMDGGTITTTLGNFTKIEVSAMDVGMLSGTGWSGNSTKKTWTGNASSVSFSGDIMGMVSNGNIQFVFTIVPTN